MNKKSLNFLPLLPSKVEELVKWKCLRSKPELHFKLLRSDSFLWPHRCISLTRVLCNLNPHFSSVFCHKGKVHLALHWMLQHVIYGPLDVVICLNHTLGAACLSDLWSPCSCSHLLFMSLEMTLRYLTLIYWRPNRTLCLNQPPLNSVVQIMMTFFQSEAGPHIVTV